jgi:hypothetical protein
MQTPLANAREWAQLELGGVDLGDARRNRRLVKVAASLSERPRGTLPQSFSNWAELKAAYRLLEQPDVNYAAILAPHQAKTRRGCQAPGECLMIEDTTDLDFSSHPAAKDLGPIGDGKGRGLYVHSMLAVRINRWSPDDEPECTVLGLAAQTCWTRAGSKSSTREKKAVRLARERESQRWAAAVKEIGPPPDKSRFTFVADREADIFETIERCRGERWDFIIRANQPRALLDEEGSIFDAVARSAVVGRFTLKLRSRPQRVRRDKKTGKPKRVRLAHGPRTVELEVRCCTVQVRGPWRPNGRGAPQVVNIVEAKEVAPSPGDAPIHWVLLTSWPVGTARQAVRVVKAYSRRWLIEEYHKALKTGTRIEDSQLATAARIEALLGILAIVAVRLLNRKFMATTCANDPPEPEEFGPEGLEVLESLFGRPGDGWTNRSVLRCIARLGGFIGRKSDGEPGWLTIWRGWQQLMAMVRGFELAQGERCG